MRGTGLEDNRGLRVCGGGIQVSGRHMLQSQSEGHLSKEAWGCCGELGETEGLGKNAGYGVRGAQRQAGGASALRGDVHVE